MQTKLINKIAENVRNYESTIMGKTETTYIHSVSLKDAIDVEGTPVIDFEYHSKNPKCEKFTAGQEALFDVEKKVKTHNGREYINYKIKPIQVQKPAFIAGGGAKRGEYRDPAVLMYNETLIAVMTGISQSSLVNDRAKIAEYVEFFYQEAKKKKGDTV